MKDFNNIESRTPAIRYENSRYIPDESHTQTGGRWINLKGTGQILYPIHEHNKSFVLEALLSNRVIESYTDTCQCFYIETANRCKLEMKFLLYNN